ncbi:aminoglycoside phosphotransferase family protein [uncultured Friedmanniella sp.]|uniref:aminoglycoside phosphotransferase family protein n=1 Tax=uncultured Friedmanniella sp. TaxID=335381 RepID=UPI0035C9D9D5
MTRPVAPLRLQPLTRARIRALGDEGSAWEARLPRLLSELAAEWSLTLGGPKPGGSSSYVTSARTGAGGEVVLKVSLPDPQLVHEADTLRRADGRGYVRLLAADPGRGALLLEALGVSLQHATLPVPDQLALLADTLALAWQPADEHPDAARDKARDLGDFVAQAWIEQDRPCPEAVVDRALTYAQRRRSDPGEPVFLHGDPHPGNLLAVPSGRPGGETGWCFIDPSGFVADRAYDLGVVLRDWSGRLAGSGARPRLAQWCRLLAERSGVDATRIWEWSYLERVSTGLYLRSFGADRAGAPFLRSAELLLDANC